MRTRTGKIARLPRDLQDQISAMIHNGAPYSAIIQKLAATGHPNINPGHLSSWKKGGFQDWRRQLEQRDLLQHRREWTLQILQHNPDVDLQKAALTLAVCQFFDALSELEPGPVKDYLANKPEFFTTFINSLVRLCRESRQTILPPHPPNSQPDQNSKSRPPSQEEVDQILRNLGLKH